MAENSLIVLIGFGVVCMLLLVGGLVGNHINNQRKKNPMKGFRWYRL